MYFQLWIKILKKTSNWIDLMMKKAWKKKSVLIGNVNSLMIGQGCQKLTQLFFLQSSKKFCKTLSFFYYKLKKEFLQMFETEYGFIHRSYGYRQPKTGNSKPRQSPMQTGNILNAYRIWKYQIIHWQVLSTLPLHHWGHLKEMKFLSKCLKKSTSPFNSWQDFKISWINPFNFSFCNRFLMQISNPMTRHLKFIY